MAKWWIIPLKGNILKGWYCFTSLLIQIFSGPFSKWVSNLGWYQQKLYPTWNYTEHWPERGEGILLGAEMKQEKRKVPFCSWGLWCLSPGWVWAGSGRNLLGIRRAEDGGDPPSQGMTPDRSIRDSSDVQSTTPLTSFLTRRRSGQNCSLHEENILLPSRVKS